MDEVKLDLKRIFQAINPKDARLFKDQFLSKYADHPKLEKAIVKLEEGFDDSIQYMNEPHHYHVFLRTTNSIERLNQEIRRRERVIRIFPNTQSAFRLIGAVLMDEADSMKKRQLIFKDSVNPSS